MSRRHLVIWILVGCAAVLVITLLSFIGGFFGYKAGAVLLNPAGSRLQPIGPQDASITKFKIICVDDHYPPIYGVMLISSAGNLLSSGVIQDDIQAWQWTDISNGVAWEEFPQAGIGQGQDDLLSLWLVFEEMTYQVNGDGFWQPIETSPDSPYQKLTPECMENYPETSRSLLRYVLYGEISQVQSFNIWRADSKETLVFALLDGKKGLWVTTQFSGAYDLLGQISVAVIGASCGFILAIIASSVGIIFLVKRLNREPA